MQLLLHLGGLPGGLATLLVLVQVVADALSAAGLLLLLTAVAATGDADGNGDLGLWDAAVAGTAHGTAPTADSAAPHTACGVSQTGQQITTAAAASAAPLAADAFRHAVAAAAGSLALPVLLQAPPAVTALLKAVKLLLEDLQLAAAGARGMPDFGVLHAVELGVVCVTTNRPFLLTVLMGASCGTADVAGTTADMAVAGADVAGTTADVAVAGADVAGATAAVVGAAIAS